MSDKRTSRRQFLKRSGAALAAGAGTSTIPAEAHGAQHFQLATPDDREAQQSGDVRIATIGVGIQGSNDTNAALRVPGVRMVAAADVYEGRLTRAREVWGNHLFTTRDYREVLARPDVDAVIIATPDHWHARMAIDAMNAGKDVYVEKPMVQRIEEGHGVIDAQRRTGRILQVGSQRVSSIVYAKAKELLAAGVIGPLNFIEVNYDRNSSLGAWQYSIPTDASPETIDWDRFLGHAPKRPFEPIRLFRWRNYQDYGTGVPGDLFVHLFSGIHYVLDSNGPTRVMSTGGLRHWKDGRDVPDVMIGLLDYPETPRHPAFNINMRVNFASGDGGGSSFRFIGPDGVLTIDNRVTLQRATREREPGHTANTFSRAVQEQVVREYRARHPERAPEVSPQHTEVYAPPAGYNDLLDHFQNFFNAVRSRKPVVEDAVFGFRAAGPALLTNMSYFDKRPYQWNPETMKIVG
ncbi:MAG: Gfo/Idh/MocA family oxidoreductase [Gemmatimonadetes bacterium]|nr:Gfo/Idh/MocA family oxidoreductase [Gemmatimonadota bacterium]